MTLFEAPLVPGCHPRFSYARVRVGARARARASRARPDTVFKKLEQGGVHCVHVARPENWVIRLKQVGEPPHYYCWHATQSVSCSVRS
jgi:hypothetical protein